MIIRANKNGTQVLLNSGSTWISLVQAGIPNLNYQDREIIIENDLLSIVYRRLILQFACIHCVVGGQIVIKFKNYITKPFIDAIRQDISLVFSNCFELISVTRTGKTLISVYIKKSILRIENYVNDGLTLGIITSGKNLVALSNCLDSFIKYESIINEIIVCGPESISNIVQKYPKTRLLPFTESSTDLRPFICHKKNKIAQSSKFENLLLIHERIRPTIDFSRIYQSISPHFEVIGNVMNDVDGNPIHSWTFLPFDNKTGAARLGVRLSDINHISPLHYGNGSVIFCKRDVYNKYPLDERLHWGEMEDNHWYQGLWNNGVSINTVQDFVCSDFSNSQTTIRYKKWMLNGYTIQHCWLPNGYHTLTQFLWFIFFAIIRYFFHDVLTAPFRQYRDPLVNSKERRK